MSARPDSTPAEKAAQMRRYTRLAMVRGDLEALFGKTFWEDLHDDGDAAAMFDLYIAWRQRQAWLDRSLIT